MVTIGEKKAQLLKLFGSKEIVSEVVNEQFSTLNLVYQEVKSILSDSVMSEQYKHEKIKQVFQTMMTRLNKLK